ncbi:MAG: DMT family transporter [Pseudomonadota bacterium]
MDIRALGMGIAFSFMWASAFTSARIIVADAAPIHALAIRFLISGLLGVAIARSLGQAWPASRMQWRAIAVFGLCQNAAYLGLNFVAMQWVEASLATIIASSLPLLVAAALWIFWRERPGFVGLLGLFAGFAGVALIMGTRLNAGVDPLGVGLCGIGALALTLATLSVRGASTGGGVLMAVGLQMLVGSAILFVLAGFLETPRVDPSWRLLAAFIYTILVPGLLATWVWFMLVHRIGETRAATFHFLNPVFGVAVAAMLLGERLGVWDLVGVVIVTGAILAVQLSRQSRA